MCKTKPNSNTLAGKGAFEKAGDGFTESTCNVCPIHGRHEGSYQDSTRVDDVACRILVITIVGARINIATSDLRVYVVAIDLLNKNLLIRKAYSFTNVAPFWPVAPLSAAIVTDGS
jgi:hypothetical protein